MRRLLACLLLLFLSLAIPLAAQDNGTQPTGTIGVAESDAQDAAIATRIRDILKELDGYAEVSVDVKAGIVTLQGEAISASAVARLNELAGRVEGVVAIENEVTESRDVVERLNPALERFQTRATQVITYLPLLAVAGAAFLLVVTLGFLLARLRQPWARLAPNQFIAEIYRQIIRLLSVLAGFVVALDILDATRLLSTILGAAGIVGLAIGFAVRDTVENFIASIMLSVRQPFRPNDAVEINGDEGKVIRLTSRATILLSFDGNHIRIPNATVFKSRIVNYSRNPERRFHFDVGVAPETDLASARKIALEVLEALPFVLASPAPSAWISGIGDSTVTLGVAAWIDQRDTDRLLAQGEAIRQILARFTKAGFDMPEPTYRLRFPDGGPDSDKPDRQVARPAPPPVAVGLADTDAQSEQELEEIVNAERAAKKDDDLLAKAAPRDE